MKTNKPQKNIPEGWSLIPAGEVFSFVRTYAFSRDNLVNDTHNMDGIGNIHYGDIHSTFSAPSIDLKKVSVPMVKDSSFVPKPEDLLKDGDLIMADASEDYAGVGGTVSLHGLENKKIVGGLHTFVLRDTKKKTDKYFRQYIFRNPEIRNSLQKIANGVSVYGISKTAVAKLSLPIPPLPEQNRIVAVLETWDKAIQKLSQKIEKKKNIKKGLMQELLTGKTRLSGLSEKWETNKLGHFLSLHDIKTKIDKEAPVLTSSRRGLMPQGEYYDERITTRDNSGFNLMPEGYITYRSRSDDGNYRFNINNLGYSGIVSKYYPVFTIKNGDNRFFLDFLNYNNHVYLGYSIGTSQLVLSFNELCKIKLKIPGKEEQVIIADILTTADKEILTLKRKLKTLQEQKRYLLNNLITGTIRTPETLSIN